MLSAVTDLFDGYFARKFNVTSRLGAYADPLTDKIFYLTTLPVLVYLAGFNLSDFHAALLVVLAVLFLLRDQWVSFLRSIGALHNIDAKANWSGKVRTLIAFPVICAIYYYLQSPPHFPVIPAGIIYTLELSAVVINLISIIAYTRYYWPTLKKETHLPGKKE